MKRTLFLILAATLLAVTAQAAQLPEKLRILSCDLATLSADGKIADQLKALLDKADPDIVFLQGATDWENCERICKLRPGLRVLTCSAFQAKPGIIAPQVAILARDKAVLSWVEEIPGGQGFAFALIQAGPRKLGLFSVGSRDQSASSAVTDRVLAEVKKLQQFSNNRPESFLIAGASLSKSALSEAGFETVAPDGKTSAEFWASNAGFLSRPRSLSIVGIPQPVLVSDVDTANSFSSKFAYQTALVFAGEPPAPVAAVLQNPPTQQRIWPIVLAGCGILAVLLLGIFVAARRHNTALALVPANPGDALPAIDAPTRSHLLAWLKTLFVQRLLSQRQQMISAETEATRRTLAIEEKLADLQTALQDRIAAYESRILRLETELSAATFENRDLIRSQIDLLKEKVAKAKEEFEFRRN